MSHKSKDIEEILNSIELEENSNEIPDNENDSGARKGRRDENLITPDKSSEKSINDLLSQEDAPATDTAGDIPPSDRRDREIQAAVKSAKNDSSEKVRDSFEKQEISQAGVPVPAFTVRGTRSWNTREPYIMNIDSTKYNNDLSRISRSFCFIHTAFETDAELKRYVNREMLKHRANPDRSIMDNYIMFLYSEISGETNRILQYFRIDDNEKNLFIYHLGPLTVYKIISASMNPKQYGSCCLITDDNKTLMFIPEEFIRVQTLKWFEENIFPLDLPFDSVQHFNNIKSAVAGNYQAVVSKFAQRHSELNRRLGSGREISKTELMKMKGDRWFGRSNIAVYKRFIQKTIFH